MHALYNLRELCPQTNRLRFSVGLEQTVAELQGIPCLALKDDVLPEKQIVSRSFSRPVMTLEELGAAFSGYVLRAAEKLRVQKSVAPASQAFVMTNVFQETEPQYSNGMVMPLPLPSNDALKLVATALYGLKRIYKSDYAYKKCGVVLMDLSPQHQRQASLFSQVEDVARHSDAVMLVLDSINARYGRDTLSVAAAGTYRVWAARAENETLCYTTRRDELPKTWAH